MDSELYQRNPFVSTIGESWANRRHLWQKMMDYIELAKLTCRNEIIALVGDYGCGTTHTLKYLETYLKQKGAFVSYFTTPIKGDLNSLYRGFLEDIPTEKRQEIVDRLVEDLCETPETRDLIEKARVSPEQIEALVRGAISGGRLTFSQRRIAESLRLLDRLPSATELWSRILLDLSTQEWPVFILIDEFDAALLDTMSAQTLLFDLRRLYDETLSGICLIIGLKGEPNDVKEKLGSALYTRMSLQPIFIEPLSKGEGLEFLKDLLKNTYGERKKEQIFLPFTEESASTLIELSCPCTPRRLLRICSVVFEEARRKGLKRIDRDFVLSIIMKFGEISILAPLDKPTLEKPSEPQATPSIIANIIEYGADGTPHILVDPKKLTAKEVVGLTLYAKKPTPLSMREMQELVSRNWQGVSIERISATIARMKKLVISEGKKGSYRYRLSGLGISWIENELVPKLKA